MAADDAERARGAERSDGEKRKKHLADSHECLLRRETL
jgi:hypothetical protein